ncbi:dihydrodipicolinate synthase family protein [Ornithinicoccus hortensis]|uniref:4-hydroxy-tetrahydrodipicolinate synthase n=1 Tax=Ornithinicoccus hortensis TaxID=82346 RepID=A0A542YRE0_9MICO|nr:dihydrodipicolinate synthase family protein [Ornithinicoccus hortensis]TQL50494.1 4-hydroxy-tetrahydrodipicolinate synthase [Ornithinicoccus hortensis]
MTEPAALTPEHQGPAGHPHLPGDLWIILATPFDGQGRLDHESMVRQVGFARDAGADGVVALGVFGEAASLSLAEQREVARTVASAADGLPLVLGVAGRSTAVALEQAENALAGADREAALMVLITSGRPDVLQAHLDALYAGTGAPVVLQDYPATSGVQLAAAALGDLVAANPQIVAIKAEAAPTPPGIAAMVERTGVPVFGGLGGVGLLDELAAGSAGAMTGFSHPEGLRATLDAHRAGGFEAARAAYAPWLPLVNFEAQQGISLALRKMLLHRRGVLADPFVRPPAPSVPPALLPVLEQHLAAAPTRPDHERTPV